MDNATHNKSMTITSQGGVMCIFRIFRYSFLIGLFISTKQVAKVQKIANGRR